jgi:hypothetical protein
MWRGDLGGTFRLPVTHESRHASVCTSRSSNRGCPIKALGSRRESHNVAHGKLRARWGRLNAMLAGFWKSLGRRPRHIVLGTQPLSQPLAGVSICRSTAR